jgi:hypothetical protein
MIEMFRNWTAGTTAITIMAKSPISGLRKTGNPFPNALKQTFVNGMIGYDYENSVNARLLREGKAADFKAQSRKWGVRVNACLVEHKGEHYLTILPKRTVATARFYDPLNGSRIAKAILAPHIPKQDKGAIAESQGVEVEHIVQPRDYKISGIQRLAICKQIYKVVPDDLHIPATHRPAPQQAAAVQAPVQV